jgi:putative flippase GtrA
MTESAGLVHRLRGRLGQLLRYATVSAISTAVGLSVLGVLVGVAGMPAGWANVIATATGTLPSFELNRRWVWRRSDRSILRQAVPFVALAFVELVASTLAVHSAAAWADHHHLARLTRVGVVLGANVTAFGFLWIAQFVLCDRFLFRRPPAAVVHPAGPREELSEGARW